MAVWSPTGSGGVHIDIALTNISIGYPNEGFVGDAVFPSVPVKKQSDKYYIFGDFADWTPEIEDVRAPGAEANEIPGFTVSTDTYYTSEHALQIAVTDEERENSDSPFNPDRDATELVTSKLILGKELLIHDMITNTSNYHSGLSTTLSGTAQWSDYTGSSHPFIDLKTGRDAMHAQIHMLPTLAIIPYEVMSGLEDHPDLLDRIKYSERAILTPELIASLLGLPQVLVPGVGYNSAHPGQNPTLGYIWGKDVWMGYVPARPGLKIPAFGYEFTQNIGGGRRAVDRWREERRVSDIIRTRWRYDLKLTAVDDSGLSTAAYLIKAAVS
jgi:hypothetical protein